MARRTWRSSSESASRRPRHCRSIISMRRLAAPPRRSSAGARRLGVGSFPVLQRERSPLVFSREHALNVVLELAHVTLVRPRLEAPDESRVHCLDSGP